MGITWDEAGGSSNQIRMASKCSPMHPFGCGLHQGQGQVNTGWKKNADRYYTNNQPI